MDKKDEKNAENIIKMLLNIYAKSTRLPISYYNIDKKKFIWSDEGDYSPLCEFMNGGSNSGKDYCIACHADHIKRCNNPNGRLELCHAGLWNIALPIKIDSSIVGTLISGQRRVSGEDLQKESEKKFEEFLKFGCKNKNENELIKCYFETDSIEVDDFDKKLLVDLKSIQEYIYQWLFQHEDDSKQLRVKVHGLVHDFLIPVQAITAAAWNIQEESRDVNIEDTQLIIDEMRKLAFIAENMRRSLRGVKSGTYSFSNNSILNPLKEAVFLYGREAAMKSVEIRVYPEIADNKAFPNIDMNYDDIRILINNIIQNAVKYSYGRKSGNLSLYVKINCKSEIYLSRQCCMISVENLGTGILEKEISDGLIFEDGYRGQLSEDQHRTGSGVGLYTVKKIVEAHNGDIVVKSEKKKNNAYLTTIKVYLPYKQTKA